MTEFLLLFALILDLLLIIVDSFTPLIAHDIMKNHRQTYNVSDGCFVPFSFFLFSAAETTSTIRSNTFASLSLSTTNNLSGRQQRYRCIKYDEQDY